MISSSLYLIANIPDIIFGAYLCARFQLSLKESHLIDVKCILRYLVSAINLRLLYPKHFFRCN